MAVLNREQFMNRINSFIGEDTSDESLEFISDMSDTFDELNKGSDGWKKKYEENDKEWRKKYKERFMNGSPNPEEKEDETVERDERANSISFDDLFNFK